MIPSARFCWCGHWLHIHEYRHGALACTVGRCSCILNERGEQKQPFDDEITATREKERI